MNKTAIKNFAVWARRKLIDEITYKAGRLGVTEHGAAEPLPQSTQDLQFFDIGTKNYAEVRGLEIAQRNALVAAIEGKARAVDYKTAFQAVIEEVAYTWFNRMIAIRFMEINEYLPSRVRVLSSESPGKLEPDFVTTPFETDLDFTPAEQDAVLQLKDENKLDELFRTLFIKQCNKLHEILPELFEATNDYTELLLTISFTDKDGVVYHLTHDIPERDFAISRTDEDGKTPGQVEIIGWLYQYYNTEPKDEVFALLKKNVKITKERIPAATQLFTPDWIVRYMVENSLGRLWVEGHPNDTLKAGWNYYLEEAEQEPEVLAQLAEIREDYANLKPEDIKIIDPCMGSGHILVYAFDVLMQIYEAQGYTQRDAARLIVEKNLYGLDIDERAYQLAYFAVMMKARQYDRRLLTRGIQPNLYAIRESNGIQAMTIEYFHKNDPKLKADIERIVTEMRDAKEYGSILNITPVDFAGLYARFDEIRNDINMMQMSALDDLLPLVKCAEVLAQQYDVVVTNPPYMAVSNAGAKVNDYVKKNFPDSKADLFAVFIERCGQMAKKNGYQAMITQHAWMFLSSFEKLRAKLLAVDIVNMAHLGARAFEEIGGEVVQTTSFVIRKSHIADYKGEYCRLIEPTSQQGKEDMFLAGENRYVADQSNFSKIPGSPVAYWASSAVFSTFENKTVSSYGWASKGIITGDNAKFLRLWHEVLGCKIYLDATSYLDSLHSSQKWYPCNKGGEFRKWYGNNAFIINWYHNGEEIMQRNTQKIRNCQDYKNECKFIPAITWTSISSGKSSFRLSENSLSESAGMTLFAKDNKLKYVLGFLNTNVAEHILSIINPTLNFTAGSISDSPMLISEDKNNIVNTIVEKNICISRMDWDSYETSWDFKRNPLV